MASKEKTPVKIGNRVIELSNLDKTLFPKSKITKEDLISYYEKAATRMIPLIKDRPVSMLRYPNGIDKDGFFQKNIGKYFPKWIQTAKIGKSSSPAIEMLLCNDKATLIYLANQACITPHVWLSRKDKIRNPDRMIFDLDPSKGNTFNTVMKAAHALRDLLEKEFHFKTFVMTTGSKGLHVVVPLKRTEDFDDVRSFARGVARLLASANPDLYTTEQRIEKRGKRLFIDYLRNAYAQTGVAPYAVRSLEKAPIAAPLDWSEVGSGLSPQSFTIKNSDKRLKQKDPWAKMQQSAKSLKASQKKLESFVKKKAS